MYIFISRTHMCIVIDERSRYCIRLSIKWGTNTMGYSCYRYVLFAGKKKNRKNTVDNNVNYWFLKSNYASTVIRNPYEQLKISE